MSPNTVGALGIVQVTATWQVVLGLIEFLPICAEFHNQQQSRETMQISLYSCLFSDTLPTNSGCFNCWSQVFILLKWVFYCLSSTFLPESKVSSGRKLRDHRAQLQFFLLSGIDSVLHVIHCLKIITLYIFPSFLILQPEGKYVSNTTLPIKLGILFKVFLNN